MPIKQKAIDSLKAARETVRSIQRALSDEQGFGEGRVVQACEEADHAIFQVLILLDVYGIKSMDDDALFPLKGEIERPGTSQNGKGQVE